MADEESNAFYERAWKYFTKARENLKTIQVLMQTTSADQIEEYRQPLSVDERREVTVLLSWGGPSDGYKVYFDKDNDPIEGYYFFADWFEYKEFKLSEDELDRVLYVYVW